MNNNIGIIGGGAWGTALAFNIARSGKQILLLDRNQQAVESINNKATVGRKFPEIPIPSGVTATTNLQEMKNLDLLLIVVPAQSTRSLISAMAAIDSSWPPMLLCAKGLERDSGKLLYDVVREILPNAEIAILSGPNIAVEVAKGLPTSTVIASHDKTLGNLFIEAISSRVMRVHHTTDLIGLQVVGAAKNIYAIASGMARGMALGENARATLITYALHEIAQLSAAMGGHTSTILSPAGIGDMIVTCSSTDSRNMDLGMQLSTGRNLEDLLAENPVREGYHNTLAFYNIATNNQLNLPILNVLYKVLHQNTSIKLGLDELLDTVCKS